MFKRIISCMLVLLLATFTPFTVVFANEYYDGFNEYHEHTTNCSHDGIYADDEIITRKQDSIPDDLSLTSIGSTYSGSGSGTESDPYIITDVWQLYEIENDLYASYKLGNDIDLLGEEFYPIGFFAGAFKGQFDGDGYTISNLYITDDGGGYYRSMLSEEDGFAVEAEAIRMMRTWSMISGLFAYTDGALIKNINIDNVQIISNYIAGALVAVATNTTILDSSVTGEGEISGFSTVGGLVGIFEADGEDTLISRCYTTVDVMGLETGGLVGYAGLGSGSLLIEKSYATGLVSGELIQGGLVGVLYAHNGELEVANCFSAGDVYYDDNTHYINELSGGLVGTVEGQRNNNNEVLGWVSITNCYSVGVITDGGGGLVGYTEDPETVDIVSCYFNSTHAGIDTPVEQARTDTQLKTQTTFIGWDFAGSLWLINEGETYPYLFGIVSPYGPPPILDIFTVTFMYDNVTFIEVQVQEGGTLGADMPADPVPDAHFLFLGWFDANDAQYYENTPIFDDVTLFPAWVPDGGHIFGSWVNDGELNHVRYCTLCNYEEAQAHDYGLWQSDGSPGHVRSCIVCNYEEVKAHEFGPWQSNGSGGQVRYCIVCGYEENQIHVFGPWQSNGSVNHIRYCIDCNYEETQPHTMGGWSSNGSSGHSRSCTVGCGYTESQGHSMGGWASNGSSGHSRSCTGCGYTESQGHSMGGWSSNGSSGHSRSCTVGCGYTESQGHSMGGWSSNGSSGHSRSCTGCGYTESQSHSYGSWTQNGSSGHRRTCSVCGYQDNQSHTYGSWTQNGSSGHRRTCSVCGYQETQGHSMGPWQPNGSSGCIRYCTVCNYQEIRLHNFGSLWRSNGSSTHIRNCTVCSYAQTASHSWDFIGYGNHNPGTFTHTISRYCTVCAEVDSNYTYPCPGNPCIFPYSIPDETDRIKPEDLSI